MSAQEPEATNDSSRDDDRDAGERKDANSLMLSGVGVAAIGLVAATIGGAVCPVCVVAAPALVGVGAYRRWRVANKRANERALTTRES